MEENELKVIGIIPESFFTTETTNESELKRIIYEGLAIGPLFEPLIEDLITKDKVDKGEILCSDVVKSVYSESFLKRCPMFVSSRETIANIKLITTALILIKNSYMQIDSMR
jgi:hypothetical protein